MCDEVVHQGRIDDVSLSRRSFVGAAALVIGAAGLPARAADAAVVTRDVEVPTPDGVSDAALFHPAGKGRWPAVLIWTDVLGLRPVFREMGQRLAAQGYVVLVPNFYYRVRKAPVIEGPFDFSKPEDAAKLQDLRASVTLDGTDRDAKAMLAFLDALPETDARARAGVQGYCMGGPMAFRAAAALPDRIGAMGSFHGGGLTTAAPTSPHLLIPRLKAQAYVAVAANDDQRDPASKDTLRTAFAAAGRTARVEVYPGANHGWCVAGSAAYEPASAERAWTELSALYRSALV